MTFHINWAILTLILVGVLVAYSFWKAHRDPSFVQFNIFDLIMHNGRLDKIAVIFMAVFVVTTWIMIDLQISGKMTEGYVTAYGVMWVTPLVAKVVFGANSMQGMTVPGQHPDPHNRGGFGGYSPYPKPYGPYRQQRGFDPGDEPPPGSVVDGEVVPDPKQGAPR